MRGDIMVAIATGSIPDTEVLNNLHEFFAAGYFEAVIIRYPGSLEARRARSSLRRLMSGGESS